MFQNDRVEPFAADISEMSALKDTLAAEGGHPPVTELCDNVSQRFDWLTASVETRCDSTDKCCKVVTEFDDGERGTTYDVHVCMFYFIQPTYVSGSHCLAHVYSL